MAIQLVRILIVAVALGVSAAHAEIARDIESKTEDLRRAMDAEDPQVRTKIRELEEAIRRGEGASKDLWSNIEELEQQKASLQAENSKLEKIQTVMASGLIGALVTATVAILGVFGNLRRSRAERDLRRLEVVEKARELEGKGVPVPTDIRNEYGLGPTARSATAQAP
jgi:predicted RNase H-like nuclease (RuvC/YqgF family)